MTGTKVEMWDRFELTQKGPKELLRRFWEGTVGGGYVGK